MKRVCVVCEGQTEETFIRNVVAPGFYALGLNLIPEMIETSPGHKGGALSYDRVKRHLRNSLRQKSAPIVTTFFDLYQLDTKFPGFTAAQQHLDPMSKVNTLNDALHAEIIPLAECDPERFIPHIQPYEFEALLFSDVECLVTVERNWSGSVKALLAVRKAVPTPEHINDRPESKPAAHLDRELKNPRFHKLDHGPIAAARIGIDQMSTECPCFGRWVQRLTALTS